MSDHRRVRNRKLVADRKRGKVCQNCGGRKPLTFHHRDPSKKKFALSKASRLKVSMQAIEEEANKCILLCTDCHRLEHEDFIIVPYEWLREDFRFSTLTTRGFCVIIEHGPTGCKAAGSHSKSRRVAHNKAWRQLEHQIWWYYEQKGWVRPAELEKVRGYE